MDQICPILCDNWETELNTNPVPFQNSFGIAINVKKSIENFSFFQGWATNWAIFSECTVLSWQEKTKITYFWVSLITFTSGDLCPFNCVIIRWELDKKGKKVVAFFVHNRNKRKVFWGEFSFLPSKLSSYVPFNTVCKFYFNKNVKRNFKSNH